MKRKLLLLLTFFIIFTMLLPTGGLASSNLGGNEENDIYLPLITNISNKASRCKIIMKRESSQKKITGLKYGEGRNKKKNIGLCLSSQILCSLPNIVIVLYIYNIFVKFNIKTSHLYYFHQLHQTFPLLS